MASQDKFVCIDCFEDNGIHDFIEQNSIDAQCTFCFSTQDNLAVAFLCDVVEHIVSCLYYEYDQAEEWLIRDSETGMYHPTWFDAWDVLDHIELELPLDHQTRLRKNIVSLMPGHSWCEKNPFGLNDNNRVKISWEIFCDVVKHRNRYFFENYNYEFEYDSYSPGQILRKLFEYAELYCLFKLVPTGQTMFRARFQDCETAFTTACELGPPPRDKATQSNRMSPAGVPMFYACDDAETALRETAVNEGTFVVGQFTTRRDMMILDLTQIPRIPSLFQAFPDTLEYRPREVLRFLNHIAAEISKPVERDDKAHINYVPTQVVTEFVRSRLSSGGQRIDGIKYGSTVHEGHASYVIFATQDNLVTPEGDRWGTTSNQWLELVVDPVTRWISPETILKWKEETERLSSTTLPLVAFANVN